MAMLNNQLVYSTCIVLISSYIMVLWGSFGLVLQSDALFGKPSYASSCAPKPILTARSFHVVLGLCLQSGAIPSGKLT